MTRSPSLTPLLERLAPPPATRDKCHIIDRHGAALCGAFDAPPGGRDDIQGIHPVRECKARGHKLCVVCNEMNYQLGGDGIAR